MFGLAPDRTRKQDIRLPVTSLNSMAYASLAFGVVSVIAYSIWAFRLVPGEFPMYVAITLVYISLSGFALSQQVEKPGVKLRFCIFFSLAYIVYVFFWCLFWFGLKGNYHADLFGSVLGLAAMTWLFLRGFESKKDFLPLFCVLFTCHTLGYYLGSVAYALVEGSFGRLLWGAGHGLGFGAGLGYLLHQCQSTE